MFSVKNLLKGGISGIGGQFQGVQKPSQSKGFPDTLNKTDLWANGTSNITVAAGKWIRIGEYEIPTQQRVHVGFGVSGGNPEEMGHLHFDIVDDTATNSVPEAGTVRIGYTDANERLTAVMYQARTDELSDTSTTVGIARANELLMAEMPPGVKGYPDALALEKNKLFVDFKSDADDIIVYTGIGTGAVNKWKLPITVYTTIA
jgi:hypothetical protein